MARAVGESGITNRGLLESAVAQPQVTFGGQELYATFVEKAAALGFSLIKNHPFLDGNKRTGHAAMEVFLILNGFEINASVEEQEKMALRYLLWNHDSLGKPGRNGERIWGFFFINQHL